MLIIKHALLSSMTRFLGLGLHLDLSHAAMCPVHWLSLRLQIPRRPSKAITKFYNNKKTTMGLAKILKQAGHSREII